MEECLVAWKQPLADRSFVPDLAGLNDAAASFLSKVSPTYIWWKTPEDALLYPDRLIAQVMDMGTYPDTRDLVCLVGTDRLREVVLRAEAGWFRPRSWSYWHYRLGLIDPEDKPPALPRRDLGRGHFASDAQPWPPERVDLIENSSDDGQPAPPETLAELLMKTAREPTPARYRLIAAKLDVGESLESALDAAAGSAGARFSRQEMLRALTWFGGFDPSELRQRERETLIMAATAL